MVAGEDEEVEASVVDEDALKPDGLGGADSGHFAVGTSLTRDDGGEWPAWRLAVDEVGGRVGDAEAEGELLVRCVAEPLAKDFPVNDTELASSRSMLESRKRTEGLPFG